MSRDEKTLTFYGKIAILSSVKPMIEKSTFAESLQRPAVGGKQEMETKGMDS